MKKIEWKTEKRKVSELVPAKYNPRKLSDKAREDLTRSVQEFGEVEPIVVNLDGTIVGGHQRIRVYADLGIDEVTVRVPSRRLTPKEEKTLNLRLNKNVGEWDWALMQEMGDELLLEVGFTEEEIMAGFGIDNADSADVEPERLQLLMVYPPESPKLKERVAIHFSDIADYRRVRKAVEDGRITAEKLLDLA